MQLMPTQVLRLLESKSKSSDVPALFMVHPIEGQVSALKVELKSTLLLPNLLPKSNNHTSISQALAYQLPCPVYGLQCTASAPLTSVQDLAKYYVEQVKSVQMKGPYQILGYSFGAAIAFEMGTLLEGEKEEVRLMLLDGSPSYVATHTGNYKTRNDKSENSYDADALTYFIMQFRNVDQSKVIILMT